MMGYYVEYSQRRFVTDITELAFERHHALLSKERLVKALQDELVTIYSAEYVLDAEKFGQKNDIEFID